MTAPPVALAIAGTDSGGGAGLAADLTTFASLGVHGACAVTAVTAQDTTGVHRIVQLSAGDVWAQIEAVLADLPVGVVKTGMLASAEVARLVVRIPRHIPIVVDPVLVASSGAQLADDDVAGAYREHVLARATVITPNRSEAIRLTGADRDADPVDLAQALHAMGPAVVLTGGDRMASTCRDVVVDGRATTVYEHAAVTTDNDHGTGCTYSAALAAELAKGQPLHAAAQLAQAFVVRALRTSQSWRIGRGRGPVAHLIPSPTTQEP